MGKKKNKGWISDFDEIKKLGSGGNADVYLVLEKVTGKQYALKELRVRSEEKKSRFISEIHVAKDNCERIPGIIPIFEYDSENYWYTMPIAQSVMEFIFEKDIEEIADGFLQLCETLEQLHSKGIHHRDIKPSNIYYYNNRFSFGDFGLVDFPDNADYTRSNQGLGAIFTIAPEMKRNPKIADASKADVFSLAKTLWMFLCGDEKGFDGVYDYLDESHRHNNQLVIDEYGYAKVVSGHEDGMLYSVRLESWNAGNNYVGKYSKLFSLDENYKFCLYGWLQYLLTGEGQFVDYIDEPVEVESMVLQIQNIYSVKKSLQIMVPRS